MFELLNILLIIIFLISIIAWAVSLFSIQNYFREKKKIKKNIRYFYTTLIPELDFLIESILVIFKKPKYDSEIKDIIRIYRLSFIISLISIILYLSIQYTQK
jgi:hypothetical protein